MPVDDNGNEVLRKAAQVDPNDSTSYELKALVNNTTAEPVPAQITNDESDPVLIKFRDSAVDRLNRLRTSERVTLAEHAHTLGKGDRYWNEKITGDASAAWDSDLWSVISSSGLADGAKVERQTYRVIQYFKGASQVAHWSVNYIEARAGCTKCFMIGDQSNGVGLQLNGSTLQMVVRSDVSGSVVDTLIDQVDWNKDKMDGAGSSGITLDITKDLLFEISYAHLGAGVVRLVFIINGLSHVAHDHYTSNTTAVPWAKSGNLPIRTEMINTTAQGTETTMRLNCVAVASESGDVTKGLVLNWSSGVTAVNVNATESIVSAVRLDPNTRYLSLLPLGYKMVAKSGTKFVNWRIIYRPTIVDPVWVDINPVVEELDTYTSFSGGFTIAQGQFDLSIGASDFINLIEEELNRDTYIGYDIDHEPEALALVVATESGNGSVFYTADARIFL